MHSQTPVILQAIEPIQDPRRHESENIKKTCSRVCGCQLAWENNKLLYTDSGGCSRTIGQLTVYVCLDARKNGFMTVHGHGAPTGWVMKAVSGKQRQALVMYRLLSRLERDNEFVELIGATEQR